MGTMEKRDEEGTEESSLIIWEALKSIVCNNMDYYEHDDSTNGLKLHNALIGIVDQIDQIRPLYRKIQSFCKDYDLDETTKANGYRSFLKVYDSAINHTMKILNYITKNRSSLIFRKNAYTK
jgi:Hormone-sensitive lipase (HSL) N-terminus